MLLLLYTDEEGELPRPGVPLNCRGLRKVWVSKEKKSREPLSRAATILLSKKTRAVMPEEVSSLLQQSTPSMASHTCGNRL